MALAMAPIYVGTAFCPFHCADADPGQRPPPVLFDTAFTLSLLRGIVFAFILISISFPLAKFYGEDRLIPLICALSAFPIFRGMISPNLVIFLKRLDFRREFVLDTAGKFFGFLAAISWPS